MKTQNTLLEQLLQKIGNLETQLAASSSQEKKVITESGFLKFTDKEISKMPKTFRQSFRINGCVAHVRKRCDWRYKCSYEIRYARNGYNISVSATTLEEAKRRFIERINTVTPQLQNTTVRIPTKFDDFAMYWFENFHKRKVVEKSYKNNLGVYNRHIKATLKQYTVSNVPPMLLQQLLANCPGNGKTADDVRSILNQIFSCAIKHGLAKINPLDLFVHTQHEKESGIELTRSEELQLLAAYAETEYQTIFAIFLYTGLRPNEYNKAKIDDKFIISVNSKQKDKKVHYKKIPICSNLRPYLSGVTVLEPKKEHLMRKRFNDIFPDHTLKDLRKTFNTRCIECGVAEVARKLFMGHTLGKLDNTYTGNLDDFLLAEGKKLDDWYTLYPKNTPKNEE